MMVGGLLLLLTSGPSLNTLIYTAMYATYMVIGGHYEDRRMARIFGEDYLRYRPAWAHFSRACGAGRWSNPTHAGEILEIFL